MLDHRLISATPIGVGEAATQPPFDIRANESLHQLGPMGFQESADRFLDHRIPAVEPALFDQGIDPAIQALGDSRFQGFHDIPRALQSRRVTVNNEFDAQWTTPIAATTEALRKTQAKPRSVAPATKAKAISGAPPIPQVNRENMLNTAKRSSARSAIR